MTEKTTARTTQAAAIRLHRARKGAIATALGKSVADARESGRLPTDSVLVAIAERLAVVADSAWRVDNVQVFMTSVTKLSQIASKLGLGGLDLSDVGGGEGVDGEGSAGESGDVIDRELASILGSGPALRDSPNSRA